MASRSQELLWDLTVAHGKKCNGAPVPASFPPASSLVLGEHPSYPLFRPIPRLYSYPHRMRDHTWLPSLPGTHTQFVVTVTLCGDTGVPLSPNHAEGWGWENAVYVVVAPFLCAFVPFRA